MYRFQDRHLLLRNLVLLCSCLYCIAEITELELDGLIPAYNLTHHDVIEGSGSDDVILSNHCDCSLTKTKTDHQSSAIKAPIVVTSTPSAVIAIIVILSLLLLVCIVVIVYLLTKIKYLNMRQSMPIPDVNPDDYDSDEYSVMMDWSVPNTIVKKQNGMKQK